MAEWRKYMVLYGPVPVEKVTSPGCGLAQRIRKARARGVFNAAQLAELNCSTITGRVCEEASAAAGHAMGVRPQARSKAFAESGGTVAGRRHSATLASQGELSCIEYLVVPCPQARSPVRLEGVALLSIGKVSHPPLGVKGKGQ